MTQPVHDDFTLTRDIAASPAQVFACWSRPDLKRAWFVTEVGGPDWETVEYSQDFRVGGRDHGRFLMHGGPGAGAHENVTHYLDIQPGSRISFAYTMALNGRIHSASLVTVTLAAEGGGTRLSYREQAAFFPPSDMTAGRSHGVGLQLDALAALSARQRAT